MNRIHIMPVGERGEGRNFDPDPMGPAEMQAYEAELFATRLPEATKVAHSKRPKEVGSLEWHMAAAQYWRDARRGQGLLVREAAAKGGLPLNSIRYLEAGLGFVELQGDSLRSYAESLGRPESFDEFTGRFQNPNWHAGRDLRRHKGLKPRTQG